MGNRTFTARNQIAQVSYNTSMVASFTYDPRKRACARPSGGRDHGNTLITRRVYGRSDNLPTAIVNETILNWNDRGATSFDYTYDANKNVVTETTSNAMKDYSWSTGGGVTPGYDAKDRLTYWERNSSSSGSINKQKWPHNPGTAGLSLVGDWTTVDIDGTTESRTFNDVHEILTRDPGGGSQSLAHDAKGNLTRKGGDANDRFKWDFDNMMSSADTDVDGTDDLEFTYDALGRRVSKDDRTTHTVYVCTTSGGGGMGQVVVEYTANADPSATPAVQVYVYGSYVDEPLMKVDGSGGKLYYHTNRQYSVTALTNASGTVVERYAYAAYGVTTILAPDGSTVRATTSVGNSYLYTSRRLDIEFAASSEDAIYYYRARYHDPHLGRFLGRDPMGYVDGLNIYVSYHILHGVLDPSGLQSEYPFDLDGYQPEPHKPRHDHHFDTQMHLDPLLPVNDPFDRFRGSNKHARGLKLFADYYKSCDRYKNWFDAKCDDSHGCEVNDPYPEKAYGVCKKFIDMYRSSGAANCVAQCLAGRESVHQMMAADCNERARWRLSAHFSCYAECGFFPSKGFPEGGAQVGLLDVFPGMVPFWDPAVK